MLPFRLLQISTMNIFDEVHSSTAHQTKRALHYSSKKCRNKKGVQGKLYCLHITHVQGMQHTHTEAPQVLRLWILRKSAACWFVHWASCFIWLLCQVTGSGRVMGTAT